MTYKQAYLKMMKLASLRKQAAPGWWGSLKNKVSNGLDASKQYVKDVHTGLKATNPVYSNLYNAGKGMVQNAVLTGKALHGLDRDVSQMIGGGINVAKQYGRLGSQRSNTLKGIPRGNRSNILEAINGYYKNSDRIDLNKYK